MAITAEEKRQRLQELEQMYLQRINVLTANYRAEIKEIMNKATVRKLAVVREKLGKKSS